MSNDARHLFDIELVPVLGERFQPTGFPDIGAAQFERPVRDADGEVAWKPALLVESAQSMANHLEGVGWDAVSQVPHPTPEGLPYVRVVADEDGRYLTSSRTEAHRLASAFIKDSFLDGTDMRQVIRDRLELRDDTPLNYRHIAREVFRLDPLSLLHGVFFAEKAGIWPAQPRFARAITGFIEALDARPAISGGVKRDEVRHSKADTGGSTEGYGSIPFHRTEWTAERTVASFAIDGGLLGSYGLGEEATGLLVAIARWEIRSLLDRGLRLRTACDLEPLKPEVTDRAGSPLRSAAELHAEIRDLIPACASLLEGAGPLEVRWNISRARPKKKGA